jgi:hypothetical protein
MRIEPDVMVGPVAMKPAPVLAKMAFQIRAPHYPEKITGSTWDYKAFVLLERACRR